MAGEYEDAWQESEEPADMTNSYNTKLAPEEEAKFQGWAKENGKLKDAYDYDIRGFWKDGAAFSENGHGSDYYKKPNHPTFSEESQYHGSDGHFGGRWNKNEEGETVSFTPSSTNLKNMSQEQLQRYFDEVEQGIKLDIPSAK